MKRKFTPYIKTIGQVVGSASQSDLANEPMFFSCSRGFILNFRTYEKACPLTIRIIEKLNENGYLDDDTVIDTRITMLMPGYYPSIPGWHCDDFPRYKTGQPDLESPDSAVHYMCLLSDTPDISGTKFIVEPVELELNERKVWSSLHEEVQTLVENGMLNTKSVKEGEIVQFNQEAIHTAVPATRAGWRMFFRASKSHRKAVNVIRNQVQVYVTENAGW